MDNRPIGVFDSGVGGLTVLAALQKELPLESTVYLGDTARVPYGTRSADVVTRYAVNNTRTLLEHADVKLLVVACNTASAVAVQGLRERLPIPVIGVIEPGAAAAVAASKGGTILVLGTSGTVRSGAYTHFIRAKGHRGQVISKACPLLVPLVEEGWTDGDIPQQIVDKYLEDVPGDIDTVVLGCTHYPLLRDRIAKALPAHVALVDGGEATAQEVQRCLREQNAFSQTNDTAHSILVTDAPEQMESLSARFLGDEHKCGKVELIDVLMTAGKGSD
jgi:glutamate racemase